ncbi:MAG: TlpA family protein disulfide reductase, partial [Bryobacterales bacterium]|nr:TlpA family protein disulfide reductase [Bryobacterales bacterium]
EADARKVLSDSRLSAHCYIRRAASDDRFINSVDPNWSGALPALFLYDRSGRLAQSFTGEVDMEKLEMAIRKLL